LGLMALGLGVAGALASTPGTASADSSDWLSSVASFFDSAFPAAGTSDLNLAISMNGVSLFQSGTAEAYSGNGDIAIAHGAGSDAYAFGTASHADAFGTDSTAIAGGMNATDATGSADDTAFVSGDNSYGFAGGTAEHPGSFDYALIFGKNDTALSGGDATGAGNYDGAYVEGNNLATATAQGGDHLLDVVKFYGDSPASSAAAAAEGGNHLADLFGGDPSGALADGSGAWAELLSSFDGGSFAADASNFWTDLTTLF
jgi:hypothetical protein